MPSSGQLARQSSGRLSELNSYEVVKLKLFSGVIYVVVVLEG